MSFRTTKDLVVLPNEANQNRMRLEQEKITAHFPNWRLVASGGKVVAAVGTLKPRPGGSTYRIRIDLPEGYPYELPAVHADGWTPRPDSPHRLGEKKLCVLRHDQWTSTLTIAFLIAKAAIWLAKYEVWCQTSRWPGNEQDHRPAAAAGQSFFEWLGNLFD